MAKDFNIDTLPAKDPSPVEQADALPTDHDLAEEVAVETKVPEVELILDPEYLSGDAEEVAVTAAGLDPKADYTDDLGRVVVSATPVSVPAAFAEELLLSPAVTTPEEVEARDEVPA